nr:hypothetical protein [Tanacetum cinerariifolium]
MYQPNMYNPYKLSNIGGSSQPNNGNSSSKQNTKPPIFYIHLFSVDRLHTYEPQFPLSMPTVGEDSLIEEEELALGKGWVRISKHMIVDNTIKEVGFSIEALEYVEKILIVTGVRTYDLLNRKWKNLRPKKWKDVELSYLKRKNMKSAKDTSHREKVHEVRRPMARDKAKKKTETPSTSSTYGNEEALARVHLLGFLLHLSNPHRNIRHRGYVLFEGFVSRFLQSVLHPHPSYHFLLLLGHVDQLGILVVEGFDGGFRFQLIPSSSSMLLLSPGIALETRGIASLALIGGSGDGYGSLPTDFGVVLLGKKREKRLCRIGQEMDVHSAVHNVLKRDRVTGKAKQFQGHDEIRDQEISPDLKQGRTRKRRNIKMV